MTSSSASQRHQLYRSRTHRVFFGVCGGVADYFDFNAVALRLIAILLILCTPPLGLITYILLGIMMKPAPEFSFTSSEEEDFYYTVKDSPSLALARVQRRFEQLNRRLQRMESIVTSPAFETEQELKRL